MLCRCSSSGLCFVPPAPDVMAGLYAEYLRRGRPLGLTFKQYLTVIGFTDVASERLGMDDGAHLKAAPAFTAAPRPQMISIPKQRVLGGLRVKVLLVDFSDRPGTLPTSHYESMLFSKGMFPTGSMYDYYQEVSLGKVGVTGSVHGWLRMPNPYSYYTNQTSGTGNTYPRNAQGLTDDAVKAALAAGVNFEAELDLFNSGNITALFIVHAGFGAEEQQDVAGRNNNIWSHKWTLPSPRAVSNNLSASVYLTVPHNAKVGVCAHELGHLAFQWEDFYDPNYSDDGSEWDGSGRWDLMAGGSWNGGGTRPAHPAALHKIQHGWLEVRDVKVSGAVTLEALTKTAGSVVRVVSPKYRPGQYLLLENRKKTGFDADLPGEGLLVWRVDEAEEMFKPDHPALLLLQADGKHDLERSDDWNDGDAGDVFPGAAARRELGDDGELSTSFPGAASSGVFLRNIERDATTGSVSFQLDLGGAPPITDTGSVLKKTIEPNLAIPDNAPGIESALVLAGAGVAQDLAVDVRIDHTYVGDLRVELVAPSGKSAVLHDRAGGNSDGIATVFRSSELPALQTLIGEAAAGSWRLRVSDAASADVGVLRAWGIAVAVAQTPKEVRMRRTPDRVIPDNNAAGITDSVSLSEAGVVRGVGVQVDIAHPYAGDLRLELVDPSGQSVVLANREGGDADDLRRGFSSADTPALAAFVGRPVRGTWALRVADLATRDSGKLKAWELVIDLGGGAVPQQLIREAAPNLAIPDNTPEGIASALLFDVQGTVQTLELRATIEHTYIGDLRVELVAPSGKISVLHARAGGRTKNLNLNLTSNQAAELGVLAGQPINGNWLLRVVDLEKADTGTLKWWSLGLTYS